MFQSLIIQELFKITGLKEISLEIPPKPDLGEFAFPCYPLAKERKKSPGVIAQEIAAVFPKVKEIEKVTAIGGYVNFFINKLSLREIVLHDAVKKNYGKGEDQQTIVIESPSPNTNKPLHLGHLKNITLGMAIAGLLKWNGNKVHYVDLVNDRGVHICKSMLAYKKWGNNSKPTKKSDHFVGDYYVLFNQKKMPSLEEEAQAMLVAWENGDKDTLSLWKKMNTWAYSGIKATYKLLGLQHEKVYFESELYTLGKDIVMRGLKKNTFIQKDGAIIAPLEVWNLPDKVLIRSDGTSIYITQDIYLAKKKIEDFHADQSIYVVGSEQEMHFAQLFRILKLLDYPWADKCYHASYGMVTLTTGRMKSREGTVVDADDIIEEMISLAREEIHKRHPDLLKKEREKRASIIGLGALRFFLLKTDPKSELVFDPKESISFEGETGPYIQYAHARICSILEKKKPRKNINFADLSTTEEHNLIILLSQFTNIVKQSSDHHKPSTLCHYLLTLAQLTNSYYHTTIILDSPQENARLQLIAAIKNVIKIGLALLTIDAPEKM